MLIQIKLQAANLMLLYFERNFDIFEKSARDADQVRMKRVGSRHKHLGREELPDLAIIEAVVALAL